LRQIGVSSAPGSTSATSMPHGRSSRRSDALRLRTAAFEEL
jgi:hypothetical protein